MNELLEKNRDAVNDIKKCRDCGQQIVFIESKKGKHVPCDAIPIKTMNYLGFVNDTHTLHFDTCPKRTNG